MQIKNLIKKSNQSIILNLKATKVMETGKYTNHQEPKNKKADWAQMKNLIKKRNQPINLNLKTTNMVLI